MHNSAGNLEEDKDGKETRGVNQNDCAVYN